MRQRFGVPCTILVTVVTVAAALVLCQCSGKDEQVQVQQLVDEIEAQVKPLTREVALANFEASVSGNEADYERAAAAQLELKKIFSDPDTFARLEQYRSSGAAHDALLVRQLDVLHNGFLGNQLPAETLEELVQRQSAIEQRFNTHRASIDGTEYTDNELAAVLRKSTDSAEVEQAWLASKKIGQAVSSDIVELVKLRNEAARSLGFDNFQAMQLALSEQDPAQIEALFDELDELTRDEFSLLKQEIDAHLAARFGIAPENLRPWHYQNPFFQDAPAIYEVDLDGYYADQDLVQLTEDFFAGIGLPVDEVVAASDLYEKPGKYQHAFCEDIDREGDVRVLCSIKPNQYWMDTMLHEFGHAVYSRYNDPQVPWLLRDAAHAFTTEAVANLFGRLAANPDWLHAMVGISPDERDRIRTAAAASLRLEQLVFSRWSQVMFRFEKAMYEDPDQDLNTLWWDLVERYQLLHRPEGRHQPDWAAKIHIALYPAYYHNYLMGQLLASQLAHHVDTEVLHAQPGQHPTWVGRPEVGTFLREAVFEPGSTKPWNAMIESATGEPLTAAYYAQQFVTQTNPAPAAAGE